MRPGALFTFAHREPRGDLPLLGCLATLVAVLTALAAVGPAAVGRLQDDALWQRVAAYQRSAPLLSVSAQLNGPPAAPGAGAAGPSLVTTMDGAARGLLIDGGGPLLTGVSAQRTVLDYQPLAVTSALPAGTASALLSPYYVSDVGSQVRYVQGRPPAADTPAHGLPEIGVSQSAASALGWRAGETVATADLSGPSNQVRFLVSGVYQPLERGDDFWTTEPELGRPVRSLAAGGPAISVGVVLGADGPDRIAALVPQPTVRWEYRLTPGPDTVARSDLLVDALDGYSQTLQSDQCDGLDANGEPVCGIGGVQQSTGFTVNDQLTPLVSDFGTEVAQFQALASFAVASLVTIALATMVVSVRLLLRRRGSHLALRRSRGASTTELVLTRMIGATPVVLAAGALGWYLGLAVRPHGSSGRPQSLPALAATGAALLLVPLLTWHAVREPRTALRTRRRDPARSRRQVVEGTVLLLCVAGVATLRLRGSNGNGSGADLQLSAVPVLVALTAVLVLLRVYPPVLRLLAAWARRGGGAVAFVGLRRASRDAPSTSLALFVLVLTLGTAVFGGLISSTLRAGTEAGARWNSGADAVAIAPGNVQPATAVVGVGIRARVPEHLGRVVLTDTGDGTGYPSVDVITVDEARLAAADPGSPLLRALRPLAAAGVVRGEVSAQVPALFGPGIAVQRSGSVFTVAGDALAGGPAGVSVRAAGTLDAAELDDPVLGPLAGRIPPGTPLIVTAATTVPVPILEADGSTAVLLYADPGTTPLALRTAAESVLGPGAAVVLRSDELASLRDDGLTRGVDRVYGVGAAVGVLFALLAVTLELVLTSAERARTSSYLRTLGMGGRAAAGLQILQLTPLAVVAAVGGVLLGVLEPRVLGSALKLSQFTAGPTEPALHTDYRLTLALGAGLAVLVLAAAAVETAVARVRRLASVLRLGDQ